MSKQNKISVLFVAGFRYPVSGVQGGQVFAARSLVESSHSRNFRWITLDTTQVSQPPPNVIFRGYRALKRLVLFAYLLAFRRIDRVFIFTTSGLGFVEKSFMAIVASWLGKPVYFAPRSGWIRKAIDESYWMRALARATMRRCVIVVCQGQGWIDYYQNLTGLPPERFAVVNNWLPTSDYAKLCFPAKSATVKFVFLGWIETAKGVWDLLDAVSDRDQELAHVKFVICGGGSQTRALKEAIQKRGLTSRFQFRGWVQGNEKLDAIESAQVFVLPSHHEGMPNSLLECMAAGRACIVTKVGAVKEIIEDGVNGLLLDAGNVKALGEALVRLSSDYEFARRTGDSARRYVQNSHDIDVVIPKMIQLLQNCPQ